MQIHIFRRIVGIRDFVVGVKHGSRRADAGARLRGHNLRVVVHIGHNDMAFGNRRRERLVGFYKRRVVFVVPAVLVRNAFAVGYCTKFRKSYKIIDGAEGFSARPIVIFFGDGEEAVPRFKVGHGNVFFGGESFKNSARDKQHISRFGNGENRKAVAQHAVAQKIGDEGVQFGRREIIFPVQKVVRPKTLRVARVTEEQVGHILGARFPRLRVFEFLSDLGGVGHQCDVNDDSFFLADGRVEFLHKVVHRGVGLLAVNVPHRKSRGFFGIEQGFIFVASNKRKRNCKKRRGGDQQSEYSFGITFHSVFPLLSVGGNCPDFSKKSNYFWVFPHLLAGWVGEKPS